MKHKIFLLIAFVALLMSSCSEDFLDKQPVSKLTPENFLNQEADLVSYAIDLYASDQVFRTGSNPFADDANTDDMSGTRTSDRFIPGQKKVGQTGGEWDFAKINQCNYFFTNVLPKWQAGKITGDPEAIKHDIGEMYLIRASLFFRRLRTLGDFPIVRGVLPDDMAVLTAASKRMPRTEVARFILSDLDSAILLMKDNAPDGNRNRLSKNCAQLLKSRVALFEGTWLKYFKGTAFVPNGPNWPGATKDYNKNYQFPSGSIESEIDFFLGEAMKAAKVVADAVPLETNNMVIQQTASDPLNPYVGMFNTIDLKGFNEVLFWRRYDLALNLTNGIAHEMARSNSGNGLTRGLTESFLMSNGLPIYAPGSGYAGDDSIHLVRKDRDGRLQLFLKQPGQINIIYPSTLATHGIPVEPYPDILNKLGNGTYPTGYANRKGLPVDGVHFGNFRSYVGEVVYRGVEAYLNYIEACYEKNGSLDDDAQKYWIAIRTRAHVDTDFQKTIDATDLNKESANDWAVYSGGNMVDATLYNIRRERRNELMAEGTRWDDLRRWRSMDQMKTTPYIVEGFKLWGPMQKWYNPSDLKYDMGDNSTVSSPALSSYLRPHQRTTSDLGYNGYKWAMAHYLEPIAIEHFLITTENNDISGSPIYQNPGWPTIANSGALE